MLLMPWPRLLSSATVFILVLGATIFQGCGSSQREFAVVHLRDTNGEQLTEIVSYETHSGLDNSAGAAELQVQLEFERQYRYQIIERLTAQDISSQSVRNKIVELYKLPPNDPEGEVQTALCPLSIFIPPGNKAIVTVEWTERWAEGVINEGVEGQGEQLGTYEVFLGFIEPCSLINQENIQ